MCSVKKCTARSSPTQPVTGSENNHVDVSHPGPLRGPARDISLNAKSWYVSGKKMNSSKYKNCLSWFGKWDGITHPPLQHAAQTHQHCGGNEHTHSRAEWIPCCRHLHAGVRRALHHGYLLGPVSHVCNQNSLVAYR